MRHRCAALLGSLALAALLLPPPAAARAEVAGVNVKITKLPDEFEPGDDAEVVEAVVSTGNQGRCRKVRWSLALTVDGVGLDDVEVERVEEEGAFPVQVRTDGDTAQLTDVRLDPGRLCRDRTVTARYQVRFDDGATGGQVRFEARAFDADRTLLARTSATSEVAGKSSPAPATASPSAASPSPEESPDEPIPPPADDSGRSLDPTAAVQDRSPSLLLPGLIVGAALVFGGVGLLLRLRTRNRQRGNAGYPVP